MPRPAKPARQTWHTATAWDNPVAPRAHVLSRRYGLTLRQVCRASLLAAARRWPSPPSGMLALRPRPETKSRVGRLVLDQQFLHEDLEDRGCGDGEDRPRHAEECAPQQERDHDRHGR